MGSSEKGDKTKRSQHAVSKEDGQRASSRNPVDVGSVPAGSVGKTANSASNSNAVVAGSGSNSGGVGSVTDGPSGGRAVPDGFCRRSASSGDASVTGVNMSLVDIMKNKPGQGDGTSGVPKAVTDVIDRLERNNNALMDFIQRQRLDLIAHPQSVQVLAPVQQAGQVQGSVQQAGQARAQGAAQLMEAEGYETDEDEFNPEGFVADTMDSDKDEDDDDESMEVSSKFAGTKKRHAPDPMGVFLWSQARKTGSDFVEDEWKSVNQSSLIKSYTAHPLATVFAAQMADAECPDLVYKDKRDFEKQLKNIQNACGASAAATAKGLVDIQDECEKIAATVKDYRDPQIMIEDPRSEMGEVLDAIKRIMMNGIAKTLSEALKIHAWSFNQLLMLRRGQFLYKITQEKNARAICKRLNPSDKYLFGEKLGNVCKNLKESVQLNPLAQQFASRSSYGSGYFRGGFKGKVGFRGKAGYKGRGAFRGKVSNERINRFSSGTKPRGG